MKKCPLEKKGVTGKVSSLSADGVSMCMCVRVCEGSSKSPGEKPARNNPSSAFLKALSRRGANPISFNGRLLRTADFISTYTHTRTHSLFLPFLFLALLSLSLLFSQSCVLFSSLLTFLSSCLTLVSS